MKMFKRWSVISLFIFFGLVSSDFLFVERVEASRCKPLGPTSVIFRARDSRYIDGFRIDYASSDFGGCVRKQIISNIQPEFWQVVQGYSSGISDLGSEYTKSDYDLVVSSGIFKIEVRNNCGVKDSNGNIQDCFPVAPIEKISDSVNEADLMALKDNYAIEIQKSIEKTSRQELQIFLTILGVTVLAIIWPLIIFKIWPATRKWGGVIVSPAIVPQFLLFSIFLNQIGGAGLPTLASGLASLIASVLLIIAMIWELIYLVKRLIHKFRKTEHSPTS